VMTLTHLARLQMRQGHLHQSHRTLQRALQLATDANGRLLPIASEALLGLGMLEREWNDLATAADHLTESIELSRQWSELAAFDAYFPLARVRLAQGDLVAARLAIETAREIAQKSEGTEWDDIIVEYQQAYISAIQKDITTVMDWAAKRGLLPGNSYQSPHELDNNQEYIREHLQKYEQLILARLFIYQSKITEALALLESLLAQVKIIERPDLTIEVQILKALAFQVKGDEDHSMESLSEALFIAESGGYIRIFLDEGQPMIKLLRLAASRGIFTTYVIKLLAAFGGSVSTDVDAVPLSPFIQPLIEPLSGRELEVLRLLVTTMSVPEIANKLVLATTTVRSHCKSIYSKMNVHKRWDAVQRAQELGLI
jgi:LuxR family maltose regulon positive regulatory protein